MPTFRTSKPVSAADFVRPHVVLVGLPGSGKTTVGRAVAEKLGRSFLDFDAEIERREMASVAEIFASRGEPAFRKLEYALTEELREVGHMVLAPGGGWMANPGCMELLRPRAQLFYLRVRPEAAMARMGTDATQRPLLRHPDSVGELRRLLGAREQLYLQADHTVNTETMRFSEVVDHIVALAPA